MREAAPANKAMKLTRLSAAPGRQAFDAVAEGAASCPRRHGTAGTASQLIASVRLTQNGAYGPAGEPQINTQATRQRVDSAARSIDERVTLPRYRNGG